MTSKNTIPVLMVKIETITHKNVSLEALQINTFKYLNDIVFSNKSILFAYLNVIYNAEITTGLS